MSNLNKPFTSIFLKTFYFDRDYIPIGFVDSNVIVNLEIMSYPMEIFFIWYFNLSSTYGVDENSLW